MDALASLLFLTINILIINLSFTRNTTLVGNLSEALLYFAICVAFWVFYEKMDRQTDEDELELSSFFTVLQRSKSEQLQNGKLTWIIKYYYLLMFLSLCILSLMIGLLKSHKSLIFIVIICGCLIMIFFTLKAKQYKQRLNTIRFILNNIIMIICMALELVANLAFLNSTQFELVLILFITFIFLVI